MARLAVITALALVACACATSEPPPPGFETSSDPRARALEQSVSEAVSRDGGVVARRTSMSVTGVKEVGENLLFDLHIVRSRLFGRPEEEFTVASGCPAASPEVCHDKAIAALRAEARTD